MKLIIENKIFKATILIVILIGLPLFLALYEQMFLSVYQESIADKCACYFVFPLMIVALIYLAVIRIKSYKNSKTGTIWSMLKKALPEAFVVVVISLYVAHMVVSGAIIFINANIGHRSEKKVEGIIVDKVDYNGTRSFEYKLRVKTDTEILVFQTDADVIVHHNNGDMFSEDMFLGSLGLLYKK